MSARDLPRIEWDETQYYAPVYVAVSEYSYADVGVDLQATTNRFVATSTATSSAESVAMPLVVVGDQAFTVVTQEAEVGLGVVAYSATPTMLGEVANLLSATYPVAVSEYSYADVGVDLQDATVCVSDHITPTTYASVVDLSVGAVEVPEYYLVEAPVATAEDVATLIGVARYVSTEEVVAGTPPWVSAFLPSATEEEEKTRVLGAAANQALAQIARASYELTGSESAKLVAELLEVSSRGDHKAISQNPIFRMAIKLLEVRPLVDERVYQSFLSSSGLQGFEDTIRKVLRGEQLTLSDLDTLYRLAELYRQKWNDFASVAMFALDPGDEDTRRKVAAWRAQLQPGVLYPVISPPTDEYYEALAKLIARGGDLKPAEWFTKSKELVERVAGILGGVDVLGNLSRWVRDAVGGALRGLGVPENVANTVASGVAGFVTGATTTLAMKATAGLAAPVVMGMLAVSAIRGLFEAGLKLDNPIEAQLLVEVLKERWPEIVAGVAGGVAGGYAGAKIGDIVGRYIATDLLPHLYRKAADAGNAKLASAIEKVMQKYEQMYSDKLYILQFRGEKAEQTTTVVVDPETGRAYIRFMVYSEGRWHLRGVETATLRNSWFVRAAGKDFVSAYLSEATKGMDASKALQSLDDLVDEVVRVTQTENLEGLVSALKQVLSSPRFAKHIASVRVSMSGDVLVLSSPDEVALIYGVKQAGATPSSITLPRYQADALWLYARLREMRVDPAEFVKLFKTNAGKGSWSANLGDYTVEFSNGKLSILFRDSKLVEIHDVSDDLVMGVADLHANAVIRGLGLDTLKSLGQAVAAKPQVPTTYVAAPNAPLVYDRLKQLIDSAVLGTQTGRAAGVEHVITSRGGVIAVARDIYATGDKFQASLLEKVTTAKVLQSDDLLSALRSAAKEAADEVGRGYILQEFVIAVRSGRVEDVARLLTDAVGKIYEAASRGDIGAMSGAIADAVQRYISATGDVIGASGLMMALAKLGQAVMGGVQAQISIPVAVAQSAAQGTTVILVGATVVSQAVQQLRQDVALAAVTEMTRRGQLSVWYVGSAEATVEEVAYTQAPEHSVVAQVFAPQEESRPVNVSPLNIPTYVPVVEEVRQEHEVRTYASGLNPAPEHQIQSVSIDVSRIPTYVPVVEEVRQEHEVRRYFVAETPRSESSYISIPVSATSYWVYTPVVEEVRQESIVEDSVHTEFFAPHSEAKPLTASPIEVADTLISTHEHAEQKDLPETLYLTLRFGLSEEVASEPIIVTVTVTIPIPTATPPEPTPTPTPTTFTPRIYFTPEIRQRDTWYPRTVREIIVI